MIRLDTGWSQGLNLNATYQELSNQVFWNYHQAVLLPNGEVVDAMVYAPGNGVYGSIGTWEDAFLEYPDPNQEYTTITMIK